MEVVCRGTLVRCSVQGRGVSRWGCARFCEISVLPSPLLPLPARCGSLAEGVPLAGEAAVEAPGIGVSRGALAEASAGIDDQGTALLSDCPCIFRGVICEFPCRPMIIGGTHVLQGRRDWWCFIFYGAVLVERFCFHAVFKNLSSFSVALSLLRLVSDGPKGGAVEVGAQAIEGAGAGTGLFLGAPRGGWCVCVCTYRRKGREIDDVVPHGLDNYFFSVKVTLAAVTHGAARIYGWGQLLISGLSTELRLLYTNTTNNTIYRHGEGTVV